MFKCLSFLTLLVAVHANAHVEVQPLIKGKWQVIQRECSSGMVPFDGYDLRHDVMTYSFSQDKYFFSLTINSRKLLAGRPFCKGEYEGDLVVASYPRRATDGIILKKAENFIGLICPVLPDREFAIGVSGPDRIYMQYSAPEICFGTNNDLELTLSRLSN